MATEQLYFNGVNGSTGRYVLEPRTAEQVAQSIYQEVKANKRLEKSLAALLEEMKRREAAQQAELDQLKAEVERLKAELELRRRQERDEAIRRRDLERRNERETEGHFGVRRGIKAGDLAEAGWGVITAKDADPGILEALKPLLDLRRQQAGRLKPERYQEFTGYRAYRTEKGGETKQDFLARFQVLAGNPADPDRGVPYYLLIVADPRTIPYRFQYELDIEYAVGRIWFELPEGGPDLAAFERYARNVTAVEGGEAARPRRVVFFGVRHEGLGEATQLSHDYLVQPLVAKLSRQEVNRNQEGQSSIWTIADVPYVDATRKNLERYLGGAETPALLFTASHGMVFNRGDERQLSDQGALLCQDWPGRDKWGDKPTPPDFYFGASNVSDQADLRGLIAFHFACYGGGTPHLDDYPYAEVLAKEGGLAANAVHERMPIADHPFVARLPQRMLSAPRGALAVISHVERAWACSFFTWNVAREQTQVFESVLQTLMEGGRVGEATEYINQRFAAVAGPLAGKLDDIRYDRKLDEAFARELTRDWMAYNDAGAYVVVGDPAVKLNVAQA